jgi:hypothetical protein
VRRALPAHLTLDGGNEEQEPCHRRTIAGGRHEIEALQVLWDTPNVAHDKPTDQRFHASVMLGFTDADALRAFFGSGKIAALSGKLPEFVSAVHAYEVT